jgi:hypothetical protein
MRIPANYLDVSFSGDGNVGRRAAFRVGFGSHSCRTMSTPTGVAREFQGGPK